MWYYRKKVSVFCSVRRKRRRNERTAANIITNMLRKGKSPEGKEFVVSGIVEADVVDTLGAGDSYIAGFLNKALEGEPLKRCMEAGAEKAALTISHFGAW